MVEKDGEKKTRSSKSRRPRLPKSYRLQKKIPGSTSKASSKLKKLNCGDLNCTTEKLSSLLMCQKGYASFAFYAIFTLFILAFIYVLWKIVSANTSRSEQNRRPEASPKVSPTAAAPTWSEEDQEELKKFFPTTAPFVPTNIETREKIEPTSSPFNSPEPSIPLKEPNPITKELTRPTQSQAFQLGAYLPSLPRLLRGSVYGEDVVTPSFGRGRQNAVIGEDFTPLPATSPFTSRWPSLSNTNWKANQQERQLPWSLNQQQRTPWAYQRRNPLQSLMRNSELSSRLYGERGQYSQEKPMKSSSDTTKKMPNLQGDNEVLHKKYEDKKKRRHHRSHTQKRHHYNKHRSSYEDSTLDPENERDDTRNTISHSNFNDEQDEAQNSYRQHASWKHHHMKFGEDMLDEKDMDAENNDDYARGVRNHDHQHHHHHRSYKQHEHPYQHDHQFSTQQQHDHYHQHQKQHQHHRHHHHQQEHSQDDGEEKEEKHVHLHHVHHNPNHHHHHHHHRSYKQHEHPYQHDHQFSTKQQHDHHHHHQHQKQHQHHRHQQQQQEHIQDDGEEKEEKHVHLHHVHHHFNHHHHTQVEHPSKKHLNHKHELNEEETERRHKTFDHHSLLVAEHAKSTKHLHHPKHGDYYHHHKQQTQKHQIKKTRSHITRHHRQSDSKHKPNKHSPTKNPLLKRLHHILDYKHYLRFKQSHTLDEEVHGNWKGIRQKTKDCINIRTFSANGKVRLTRARYRAKYLYTVLVCKVVQVRKRQGSDESDSAYRTAQLCHKLYFVTKSIVRLSLDKPSKGGISSPEFKVKACKPSKDVNFQAMSFQGVLSHKDRSQRSDIPKHKHKSRKVSLHKKSKKEKLVHKHKEHKGVKGHKIVKHKTKVIKHHKGVENHPYKKGKLKSKKLVSQKHEKKNKKEAKANNQEDVFFGKLLNILTIASGNNRTSNSSNNPLMKLKGALQKMKKAKKEKAEQLKKKHKTHSKGYKKHLKVIKMADVSSSKYIQNLLKKILPSVVSNVKADLRGSYGTREMSAEDGVKEKVSTTTTAMPTTPPTTKPTTNTTTTTPTTTTTTPTTATTTVTTTSTTTTPTTKPTTKSKGLEDELKDILPLLLKKAQLAKKTTTTQKPTTVPTTKPTTFSKTKEIKDLLARLKLGGIDLSGLVDSKPTREAKATNVIHTTVQQKLNELSEPASFHGSPTSSLQSNMNLNQITNNGGPVSVLGNDPFSKNILCFGDSLTRGYYNHGRSIHPYSIQLSRLINSNSQTKYNLVTSGKNGEMTHGSMTKRLPDVLGNNSHFDWVIILAGTNDVAHVKNFGDDDSFMNQLVNVWSPKIFQDIISLHETAYKYGARTVLLTIPESAYEAWPQFRTLWVMRRKINQELRDYANRSQGKTILCDLAIKIPRHTLSPQMQKLLWSDHLHLTPFGYDKMAGLIYQCIKPYL